MPSRIAVLALALALALTAPEPALAYVGPGAGLSLLGALWALLAALGMALFFVIAWPVRRMLRRRKAAASERQKAPDAQPERRAS